MTGNVASRGLLIMIAVVMAAVALPAPAVAETPQPRWASGTEIDAFLTERVAQMKLSGLAAAVITPGRPVHQTFLGEADPSGRAITEDTPFIMGSVSKQFTGLAIQQLVGQGRLGLDDTIGARLAGLGGADSALAPVTVAQLLSHHSGLATNDGLRTWGPGLGRGSITDESRRLLGLELTHGPGQQFEYSNANYTLLGAIIEQVTGQTYAQAFAELVAGPLGLAHTTADEGATAPGLAASYYTWFGLATRPIGGHVPRWGAPAAFTVSTLADMTVLISAHLDAAPGAMTPVLEAAREPLTPVVPYFDYASGWWVRPCWELGFVDDGWRDPAYPKLWTHGGSTGRFATHVALAPEVGYGVVLLSNTGVGPDQDRMDRLAAELTHLVMGTEPEPRPADLVVDNAGLLMLAAPLAQLAVLLTLVFRPRARWARITTIAVAVVVTALGLAFSLWLVPSRSGQPLLMRTWWDGVPDVAFAVSVQLGLAALSLGALAALGWRHDHQR